MPRATNDLLHAKCKTINDMIGVADTSPYTSLEGQVSLHQAYGNTGVVQKSAHGGSTTLMPLDTRKEAAYFLDGMIAGLRIANLTK